MTDHADRKHKRYSPSQMARLAACPGSDRLTVGMERRDSTWSIEGTKAHTVLDAAIENRVRDARVAHKDYSPLCMEELDVEYGGPYTTFYLSIQSCLDHVFEILDAHPHAVLWNETYVEPPSEAAPDEAGGFCDIAIYDPGTGHLWIIDYKHGAGVGQVVRNNKQALQYAAGFLYDPQSPLADLIKVDANGMPLFNEDGAEMYGADVSNVTLTIAQPRNYNIFPQIRSYDLTPYEVYEYLSVMDDIIRACQAPDAPLIPETNTPGSANQCQFCPANTSCPARESKALAAVNTQFRSVRDIKPAGIPEAQYMELAQLEYTMTQIPLLEDWIKSVKKRLYELAMENQPLQFFKLVEAQARRKWDGEPATVAEKYMQLAGVDLDTIYPRQLITITEAQEIIVKKYKENAPRGEKTKAAEHAKADMAFLTVKETSGGLSLVPLDDDRPAINRATVAFAQIAAALTPPEKNE